MGQHRDKPPLTCTYCLEPFVPGEGTRDHVPPKSFFNSPRPSDLVTVPACRNCNNSFSSDDEEFRAMLGLQGAYKGRSGTAFWLEGALPTLLHNKRLRRELIAQSRPVEVRSMDGAHLGSAHATLWRADTHDRMIARIARGLYRHEFGTPLRSEHPIRSYWLRRSSLAELMEALSGCPLRSVGDGQFVYMFARMSEQPTSSLWLFQFHGRHAAGAWTGPGDLFEADETELANLPDNHG